jgi:outer membrane protein assembly factor BamB/ABC-type phosphate/phosphonate transport system substrate-binding protein
MLCCLFTTAIAAPAEKKSTTRLIVLDPLSKELACACVKGYGQRDYRKLASRLESALKSRVSVEFSDDLAESLASASNGPTQRVIVIGPQSLVAHGANKAGLRARPICALTDTVGETTLTGLIVARANDSARELKDITGRRVFFGLARVEDLFAAATNSLRDAGVELPAEPEMRPSYNDAALDVLDSQASPAPVAVIPNYALPLLEGCGSIKPGDLKVLGKTKPVPFIVVFLSDSFSAEAEAAILKSLVGLKSNAKLLKTMESRNGFKPLESQKSGGQTDTTRDWPDWRGPDRDGRVPRLPARLPAAANLIWKKAAMTGGLAGLSVSAGRVIVAERDFAEEHDVYRCLNADDGETLWRAAFPARGQLDYGQAPRATPVIRDGRAFLLGAFGGLRCVDVASGKVLWQRHLAREFKAELPTWGFCATPLVVDNLVIVNPGGRKASLAALDAATGRTRWTAPGGPAAYAAFIHGNFGGKSQIVGYDAHSLDGWEVETGRRLWQLMPPKEGDFNVPTPIAVNGGVLLATENNGTRLHHFDDSGRIISEPAARFDELAPDTATPVVTNGRVFGTHQGLRSLDLDRGLKQLWHREDETLGDYAALIADDQRVLVITVHGELLLLDARAGQCDVISRLKVFEDDVEVYSHPALVGSRLFIRGGTSVRCVDLNLDLAAK